MKCKECPQCDSQLLFFQYWEMGFFIECGKCTFHVDEEDNYLSLSEAVQIWNTSA